MFDNPGQEQHPKGGTSMEIRFTVWQFVRLMVHLEEGKGLSPAQAGLLESWGEVWSDLDQNLADLAQSDPDAYSALMMDQDVVFADATESQADAAGKTLERVMKELDAAQNATQDEDMLASLKFERRELRQLARKLSRLAEE